MVTILERLKAKQKIMQEKFKEQKLLELSSKIDTAYFATREGEIMFRWFAKFAAWIPGMAEALNQAVDCIGTSKEMPAVKKLREIAIKSVSENRGAKSCKGMTDEWAYLMGPQAQGRP